MDTLIGVKAEYAGTNAIRNIGVRTGDWTSFLSKLGSKSINFI